jgi:hypothetical protein
VSKDERSRPHSAAEVERQDALSQRVFRDLCEDRREGRNP